ncbi:unnamed protein product [Bemisia tabaci]|uniref:CCR4-NOT transcription complex subunit 1 n=1 Tax=Bemisia tabaci TaxID=7038 RepID=A0A9P0G2P1_BEMTA|nr:unnamed protein product [Bemisia tabaci]
MNPYLVANPYWIYYEVPFVEPPAPVLTRFDYRASSPLIFNELENSLADTMLEVGYSWTENLEGCRERLSSMAGEIKPGVVARVLGMMARSHTGLPSSLWPSETDKPDQPPLNTWNVDVFVQALKEVAPNLLWPEVIRELDYPDFLIKDRRGLSLIITALRLGLQSQGFPLERFPVELFYRPWKYAECQFSLLKQILKNSDVFCFADYPSRTVPIESLKSPPESDNKEIASWCCVDLVETILQLAERGLFNQVQDLLKMPMQICPDILTLAILHGNLPITPFRQELLSNLMPIFFSNHPNSAMILHHAWHSQSMSVKQIIMHAMADWYLRGDHDQARLSRILDVAQDLKALSLLLNAQSFPFVIDLACLASRREYLKLEKWLNDKIREHGETFLTACVNFLQRKVAFIFGGPLKDEAPKSAQLPHETLSTIITTLQKYAGTVSQDLSDAIMQIVSNSAMLLCKPRQPPPGVIRSHQQAFTQGALFQATPPESIASLSSSLAGISLSAPPSSTAFSLPGALGPLVSNPGSPSRLIPPSQNSPYLPHLPQLSGPVGTPTPSILPNVGVGSINRVSTQSTDKTKLSDSTNLYPEISPPVSKDIEDEANSYFQRIYNHPPHPTLSIEEVLEMLKKFKDSQNPREREVYTCMLRNLFEEYKFFPQYPDKELHITAQLFGGIVEQCLVANYVALGLALRVVLDALKKPHGSKMYYFGIVALDRFKSRLKEFQKYCEHISSIPHFNEFPPHLIEYIEYGKQSEEPPNHPTGPVIPPPLAGLMTTIAAASFKTMTATTTTATITTAASIKAASSSVLSTRPSIANATNIDTLLVATEKDDKIVAPPETMQDKVAFIFNNLSQLNLQTKCDELHDVLTEEYWTWMAQYLVMKRASIELNFHVLYSNFLDVFKVPKVNEMVLKETHRNIKVLLRSDKGIANFSDRSLLKNLGHWLGMLTLGRNKPILQVDLDIKSLLVEAYQKGQQELLYVVPFIAKILESCSKSKVFKPPNPWTLDLMNVLAELHQEADLKLNLKFEIEVLCKNLSLDVAELKPGTYLKDPEVVKRIEQQLSSGPAKKPEPPVPPATMLQTNIPPPTAIPTPVTAEEVVHAQLESARAPSVTPLMAPPPVSSPTPMPIMTPPVEPRFNYNSLSVSVSAAIERHCIFNPQLALFQAYPGLKGMVRQVVERAVQELIHPVMERSIKIAVTTAEIIVKKDFALDPEEARMRAAAHHMVRNLTGGMVMISCRDQLLLTIVNGLKTALTTALSGATAQQKELIEHTVTVCAQENMELACAIIQKTAMEKALVQMDKHLTTEYERRKLARNEGRRYCDPQVLTYQAERMPEQIRLKVGGVTNQQMAVYEEFFRNLPGFQTISDREVSLYVPRPDTMFLLSAYQNNGSSQVVPPMPYNVSDEVGPVYDKLVSDIDAYVSAVISSQGAMSSCQVSNMHNVLEALMIVRRSREPVSAIQLIQKCVEGLLDNLAPIPNDQELAIRYRELHLRVLKTLQDQRAFGPQWTSKYVTKCLMECREEFKYNLEAIDVLVRSHLVNIPQYDLHVAQSMDNGLNYVAVAFAMQLVQLYLVDDRNNGFISDQDLVNTIEVLIRIAAHSRQPPEGLTTLIEILRSNHDQSLLPERLHAGPTSHIHSGILQVQARDFEDPPDLYEKTEFLLREWVSIINSPNNKEPPSKAFSMFVHQMNVQGILKTDDLITRFFRLSTSMVVELSYRLLSEQTVTTSGQIRLKIYHTLDAYVKLIAMLVKHSGDTQNTQTKINLLNKVLGIIAGVLLQDHESHHSDFQQLPYHRIFIMLFLELNSADPVLEAFNFQILTAFCHTLHILRPAKSPGFAYSWLELISHRVFIGRLLQITPQQKGWGLYAQLLMDLFKFLAPFLRNAELAKPVTFMYKGTLRVLLILLHDFPEFLCDYHYGFCDVVPPNCIQMRNLILSAFPRNMRLPDPFTPNLKVDMLQEIAHAPRVSPNFASMIQPLTFKKDLDSYLKARAPVTFLSELRSNLQVSNEPGVRYNISLLNALVLYVGTQAISFIRGKGLSPNMSTIAHSAHMDIFQNLAVDLDTEGRYLFLNAIANQLRYPNSHTHYFSCTLLYLFHEANTEAIQEQITRVLLERLIVNRPHPWGLLITFIEMIKNPTYKFWNHEFVHCAPEIEKLFESVARSCMVQKAAGPERENEMPEM